MGVAMSKQKVGMSTGAIALSNRVADKLIGEASGDAALLFLYLLRQGGDYDPYAAAKALRWTGERVADAFSELEKLELVKGPVVDAAPAVSAKDAPRYSAEMIRQEMDVPSSRFPGLLDEVERKLGNKLNYQNMQILMELYDYLALPAEVILLLVSHMIDEAAYRKGPGVKPKMWEIKREGYRWAAKGLDNLDAATAYVKKMDYFRTNEGRVLAMVGINGRTATDREKTYINAWLDMGFEDGVIQMAYERTLFKVQNWNWNYCNGILKSWHKDGLHTLNDILDAEQRRTPRANRQQPAQNGGKAQQTATAAAQMDDILWIQKFMQKHQGEFSSNGTGGK